MMCVNSVETDQLQELIDNKKKYLSKQTNKTAAQYLQKEIIFLERDILPCVRTGTQLLYYECAKYFINALDKAVEFDCNGFLVYIGLKDEYDKRPKVGIFNPKDGCENLGDIHLNIINMEIGGSAHEPINLFLHSLTDGSKRSASI